MMQTESSELGWRFILINLKQQQSQNFGTKRAKVFRRSRPGQTLQSQMHTTPAPVVQFHASRISNKIPCWIAQFCFLKSGILSHLRTMLPKSSSWPLPAQQPNHATESLCHSKFLYNMSAMILQLFTTCMISHSVSAWLHREVRPGARLPIHRPLHRGEGEAAAPGITSSLLLLNPHIELSIIFRQTLSTPPR